MQGFLGAEDVHMLSKSSKGELEDDRHLENWADRNFDAFVEEV